MEPFLHDWVSDANDKLRMPPTAPTSPVSEADDQLQLESVLDLSEAEIIASAGAAAAREAVPDATVLVEGPEEYALGKTGESVDAWNEEPVLSMVSLNPRTAASFDLVRGSLTLLPELPASAAAVRTVRVSCGRDACNTMVLSDSRVSQVHFTVRVRAARGGLVTLELLDQSSNGTWVNGKRVGRARSVPLSVGDQILVLPASTVGRAAEVGYLLLHDARGARCGAVQENQHSLPPSPRDVSVPRDIEDDIRCGICTDVLFRCLTLVPCGHNFCTACLVKWRRRSYACPECREPVQQAVRSTSIDSVVETFLLAHPKAARSEAEIKAMEMAERDPNNTAMLRWLTRPGPSWTGGTSNAPRVGGPHPDARSVATPMRRMQDRPPQRANQAQHDSASSSACVIS
uniref:E3 ubiquitin-protein ligase CHFR n=1 Tax=Alexandrium catenella TaxID=2925 RepID=A0A7S1WWK8_ALECA